MRAAKSKVKETDSEIIKRMIVSKMSQSFAVMEEDRLLIFFNVLYYLWKVFTEITSDNLS